MVGNSQASKAYVGGKRKDCEECGIGFYLTHFAEEVSQQEIVEEILALNANSEIDGILVQLPLPQHLDKEAILGVIAPSKDVDCFCEENLGRMFLNKPGFYPCTPLGIIELMNYYQLKVEGKHCVIVGRSDVVGKPLATMLTNLGATVTICHSKTTNLCSHTQKADIIISAVGKEKFITADMIKPGAIVIDVGINRNSEGKMCGDVDFDEVAHKASAITPVPGGVGLMTRAALLMNVLMARDGTVAYTVGAPV